MPSLGSNPTIQEEMYSVSGPISGCRKGDSGFLKMFTVKQYYLKKGAGGSFEHPETPLTYTVDQYQLTFSYSDSDPGWLTTRGVTTTTKYQVTRYVMFQLVTHILLTGFSEHFRRHDSNRVTATL